MQENLRKNRRTHRNIRILILRSIRNNQKSIHEIAKSSGINWRSTELHLTFLKGKEFVQEVFRHHQLRVFAITKQGKKYLRKEYENK